MEEYSQSVAHRSSSCPPVPKGTAKHLLQIHLFSMVSSLVPSEWDNYVDDRNNSVANKIVSNYNAGFQYAAYYMLVP